MWVTYGCWWLYVGDRISILVTSFGCWCPTPMRGQIEDVGNRPKPSSTCQSCCQHPSSTSIKPCQDIKKNIKVKVYENIFKNVVKLDVIYKKIYESMLRIVCKLTCYNIKIPFSCWAELSFCPISVSLKPSRENSFIWNKLFLKPI